VTPTIPQRLWLRPVELTPGLRRNLLAAQAAFVFYVTLPTVALATSIASVGPTAATYAASFASYALGALVLLAYERLPDPVRPLLGAASIAVVSSFVAAQPEGELYALLYVSLVFYACFFFDRRRALAQVALVLVGAAVALPAAQHRIGFLAVIAGTCVGSAAVTLLLRRQLLDALAVAKKSRATLDAFFDHAAGGFAFLDSELRYVRVNGALAATLGCSPSEVTGRTIGEVSPHESEALEPLLLAILANGEPVQGLELTSSDGARHFLVDFYPVGSHDGIGMAVADVTRLKHAERSLTETNRQLTVLATTDELTGLPNRRMLSEQLALALARARRGGLGVALLSIDLDGFKSVNDSLGHAYGDQLLVEVAQLLRAGARDTDVVARIGGDEFVVVLADLDVQDAPDTVATVVERIEGLLASPISIGPVELRADASIGVAVYPLDAREQDDLLCAADASMYRRKRGAIRVA
jgi:diguanylate cyclase (GGDEF)-like protein/PAS domain S-box-containing protein